MSNHETTNNINDNDNNSRDSIAFDKLTGAIHSAIKISLIGAAVAASAAWQDDTGSLGVGPFPPPPEISARYVFGWSGIEAAAADVRVRPRGDGSWECAVDGGTSGLARTLWKLDATYRATVAGDSWASLAARLTENYRRYRIEEVFEYRPGGVRSRRLNTKPGADPPRWREHSAPGLRDMAAALLLARSQPLRDGDAFSLAVFPGEDMYLVRVKVEGREKLVWRGAARDTVRLSLRIDAIKKNGTTEPHSKFQRGTVWVSDDAVRLPLRVEVKVFVGHIFTEMVPPDKAP